MQDCKAIKLIARRQFTGYCTRGTYSSFNDVIMFFSAFYIELKLKKISFFSLNSLFVVVALSNMCVRKSISASSAGSFSLRSLDITFAFCVFSIFWLSTSLSSDCAS